MTEPAPPIIRIASADEVIDLRWRILRAGLPRASATFDGDTEPGTRHVVALIDRGIIGCVTILHRPFGDQPAWQLRGMAVDDSLQRSGVGRLLVAEVERIVRVEPHSRQLWCNARKPAVGFYQRMGWETVGDEFDIPTAGPHFRMQKRI